MDPEKKKKKGRSLVDIEITEISLVDKPANKIVGGFHILKREDDNMLESLKEFFEGDQELKPILKAAGAMPDERQALIKKITSELNLYMDDCGGEFADSIRTLMKMAIAVKVEKVDNEGENGEHGKEKIKKVEGTEELKPGTMFAAFMHGAPRNIIEKFKFAQDPNPIEKIDEDPDPEPKHGKRTSLDDLGLTEEQEKEIQKKTEGDFPLLTAGLFGPQ